MVSCRIRVAVMVQSWAFLLGALIFSSAASSQTTVLSTDYGLGAFKPSGGSLVNKTVDATGARFTVANSKNSNPTPSKNCDVGTLAVNYYPIHLAGSSGVTFLGGLVRSNIPQSSEWRPTYCNSAALAVFDSNGATVDGVRVTGAWDAIRFAKNSNNFTLKRAWIENVRDDCVENDQLKSGKISDVLFDGCFQGISVDPGVGVSVANQQNLQTVEMDNVLLRLKPYPYRKNDNYPLTNTHGHIFKSATTSPSFSVTNSTFAYEVIPFSSDERLTNILGRMKTCKNNHVLWLSDSPLPAFFKLFPQSCFQVVQGKAARDMWEASRTNWIDCHPSNVRLDGDAASVAGRCSSGGGALAVVTPRSPVIRVE